MLNKGGMSLMELTIALVIGAGVMVGISQTLNMGLRNQNKLALNEELQILRLTLRNRLSCERTLSQIKNPKKDCPRLGFIELLDSQGDRITSALAKEGPLRGAGSLGQFKLRTTCTHKRTKLIVQIAKTADGVHFARNPASSGTLNFASTRPLLGYDSGLGICESNREHDQSNQLNVVRAQTKSTYGDTFYSFVRASSQFEVPEGKALILEKVIAQAKPLGISGVVQTGGRCFVVHKSLDAPQRNRHIQVLVAHALSVVALDSSKRHPSVYLDSLSFTHPLVYGPTAVLQFESVPAQGLDCHFYGRLVDAGSAPPFQDFFQKTISASPDLQMVPRNKRLYITNILPYLKVNIKNKGKMYYGVNCSISGSSVSTVAKPLFALSQLYALRQLLSDPKGEALSHPSVRGHRVIYPRRLEFNPNELIRFNRVGSLDGSCTYLGYYRHVDTRNVHGR